VICSQHWGSATCKGHDLAKESCAVKTLWCGRSDPDGERFSQRSQAQSSWSASANIEPQGGFESYISAAFFKKHVPATIVSEKEKA